MKMTAGKYYIGDLCYVLSETEWDKVCGDMDYDDGSIVELDDFNVACFPTAFGDGSFISDQLDTPILVDSGTIGCVETKYLDREILEDTELTTNIVTFQKDFDVFVDKGVICFGDIEIDTNEENDLQDDLSWNDYEDGE